MTEPVILNEVLFARCRRNNNVWTKPPHLEAPLRIQFAQAIERGRGQQVDRGTVEERFLRQSEIGDRLSVVEARSEEHTSELQSRLHLVCRLLLEKKKHNTTRINSPNPYGITLPIPCHPRSRCVRLTPPPDRPRLRRPLCAGARMREPRASAYSPL